MITSVHIMGRLTSSCSSLPRSLLLCSCNSQGPRQLASREGWKKVLEEDSRAKGEVKTGYFSMSESAGVTPSQAVALSLPRLHFL